jgi:RNase P subunit RPR2
VLSRVVAAEPEINMIIEINKRFCSLCNTMIKGGNMARHRWEHHKVGVAPKFPCLFCGKVFPRKQALDKEHICRK